jgi:hypothetical protein
MPRKGESRLQAEIRSIRNEVIEALQRFRKVTDRNLDMLVTAKSTEAAREVERELGDAYTDLGVLWHELKQLTILGRPMRRR